MSETKDNSKTMFEAGVHFGYSKSTAHPSMSPFIYGFKDGVSIFDLEKVQEQLTKTKTFLSDVKTRGKIIFCGSKNEARGLVESSAKTLGMPYVTIRWIGGSLTNFSQISKRIGKLERMTEERERGDFGKYTKKERLQMDREIAKLEKYYGGMLGMKELPKALIVVDPKEEAVAVKEARDMHIPVIAIANSDCDVTGIDYVIPANDSSYASIELILSELTESIK